MKAESIPKGVSVTLRVPNPRLAPGAHSDPEAVSANKRSSRLCSFRRDALVAHDPERNLDPTFWCRRAT
jgi:hypothetical protein